jgi:ankyrin repeat protein
MDSRRKPPAIDIALIKSILKSDKEEVRRLLREGADLSYRHTDGSSWLHMVATTGNTDILRILLETGIPIDQRNNALETPLIVATSHNKPEIVRMLLENGADVNAKRENGSTALLFACVLGKEELVQLLIERGADVNITNNNLDTPLMVATDGGFDRICEMLIRYGADTRLGRKNGATALHISAGKGDIRIVRLLLDKIPVNIVNNDNETPLLVALARNQLEIVKMLLEAGASPEIVSNYGVTAYDLAIRDKNLWKLLLKNTDSIGFLIRQKGSFQRIVTILLEEAKRGRGELLYYLLAYTEKGRRELRSYFIWLLERYRKNLRNIPEEIGEKVLAYIADPKETTMILRERLG